MECDFEYARLAIHACCILNNVCEHFGATVLLQWCAEVEAGNALYDQPPHNAHAVQATGNSVRVANVEHYKRQ